MVRAITIALVVVLTLAGCTIDKNDPVAVATTAPPAGAAAAPQQAAGAAAPVETTAPPAAPETFTVGQPVQLGDWTLTVHGVTDPFEDSSGFLPPAEGNRYVLIDAEVTYAGSDPQVVSTLMCFELQDAENRAHAQSMLPNPVGQLDGDIAPGAARRGGLVYEVPGSATGLRLNFKCDLMSTGSATVTL